MKTIGARPVCVGGSRGFTLLELMITLAVLAVLATIAFPGFRRTIQFNRVTTQVNQMAAGLALARSEAIRLSTGAGICASSTGTGCDTSWGGGWLVWDDSDGDGTLGSNETVVRYTAANSKISYSGPSTGIVVFDSRGRRSTSSTTQFVLQPSDCTTGESLQRTLTVAATGGVTLSRGNCQ